MPSARPRPVARRGALLGLALVLQLPPASARAQQAQGPDVNGPGSPRYAGGQAKAEPTVDVRIGQKLNKVVEALGEDKLADARGRLDALSRSFLSPYERSRVESLYAAVAQAEQKYAEARDHVKKAMATGGFNDQEQLAARFQVAQLFMAEERWAEGIAAFKEWQVAGAAPAPAALYLLALAHYQLKQYGEAIDPVEKAVAATEAPQEAWLQLLLALRIEREEHAKAVPILHRLLERSPRNKSYWLQLSNVQSTLGRYDEALAPAQVAYQAGLYTDEAEYRRLVDLLLHASVPHRAALVLVQAIEEKKVSGDARDLAKLGDCWIAARELERAVAPLGRAAAAADDGNPYLRLAEVHLEREEWDKASDAVARALQKGKLRNVADAELTLGMALYGQRRFREARGHFVLASEKDHAKQEQVKGWIAAVDQELKARP